MANVDIARSPAPAVASFEVPCSLIHQHPLIASHALSVVETSSVLLSFYELAYKSLYHIHAASAMSRQSSPSRGAPNSDIDVDVYARQRAPPQPDPEPAAPPIIILAQSGNKQTVKPSPQFQVPAPAEQGLGPRPPTSSLSQRRASRYNLRSRSSKPIVSSPNKPAPQPDPPAPPVIILSNEQPQPQSSQPPRPSCPTTPAPQAPAPHNPPRRIRTRSTMGSKVSKVRERSQEGKLQPSQEQLDKEQMKEPSNYYSKRSKSMRRKAAKGGDAGGSSGGL